MAVAWQKGKNATLELIYNVFPQSVNSMCTVSSSNLNKNPFSEVEVKKIIFISL